MPVLIYEQWHKFRAIEICLYKCAAASNIGRAWQTDSYRFKRQKLARPVQFEGRACCFGLLSTVESTCAYKRINRFECSVS